MATDPACLPEEAVCLLRRQNDENITCLSFGLSSYYAAHKGIMCDKCLQFNELCLSESQDVNTRKRYKKHQCEKPWHKKHRKSRYKTKRIAWRDFNRKFGYLPEADESDSNISTEGTALKVKGKSNSEHKQPEEESGEDSLKESGEVNTASLV